jgi:AbrB family looped-hinge helix DNA binding protein
MSQDKPTDRVESPATKSSLTRTRIRSNGQLAIPKRVRERLHLDAGTEVLLEVQGEALVLKRLEREYPDWRTLRGLASGGESLTEALRQERASEKAHDDGSI